MSETRTNPGEPSAIGQAITIADARGYPSTARAARHEHELLLAELRDRGRRLDVIDASAVHALLRDAAAALTVYADPRHWAIQRGTWRTPAVIWIGPGADEPSPSGIDTARDAIAALAAAGVALDRGSAGGA